MQAKATVPLCVDCAHHYDIPVGNCPPVAMCRAMPNVVRGGNISVQCLRSRTTSGLFIDAASGEHIAVEACGYIGQFFVAKTERPDAA
jgi:hypothetical protein